MRIFKDSPEEKLEMSNSNKKPQETEMQYAALTATLNLAVGALAAIALYNLFLFVTRLGDLVGALTSRMPLLIALVVFGGLSATAQTAADEQILRELIRREAAGKTAIKYAENAVFASDALPRPVVLKSVRDEETIKTQTVSAARRNQILKIKVRRVTVAASQDIAYEYSDFTISYDQPDQTRDGYAGSLLRIWRKANGEWLVDAAFARQNAPDAKNDGERFSLESPTVVYQPPRRRSPLIEP